ncbi:hypothetical protein GW17_00060945, partial [Ensete ventricosum]
GNSLGVRRELAKGIGSLPGWRKGVHRRKTETHRKIIGGSRKACQKLNHDGEKNYRSDMDPRSSLGIRPRIGRYGGSSPGVRQRYREDR